MQHSTKIASAVIALLAIGTLIGLASKSERPPKLLAQCIPVESPDETPHAYDGCYADLTEEAAHLAKYHHGH